ncbi:DUF3558 family protein [Amycolatopsis mongoliensis]|uniref:DUF3558 family protein n=1 Tax=Amycolatopsis mongoliensis TaxID=715475 RepID=A0A9Y2NAK1_9PSEU|nr:DUF3558 family protein [Amycolatopsis sp. 4-36]WIX98680.1 DUF3558 family protein [Amycolatopsis sp. 4-36]
MRRVTLVAAILACALGLSACNDEPPVSGSPKTADGGDTAAPGDGSGKTGTPLAGVDPCSLLKPADVPELDQDSYVQPTASSGEHPSCGGYDFGVTIIDHDQLAHEMDFEGSLAKPTPDISGHHAVTTPMEVGAAKSCVVSMDVTADEFVRIAIMHDKDPSKTCDIAVAAAKVVASRIPA